MILVSLSDAAHWAEVPESTVRRWVAEGRLAKHGRKPYKVDVDEAKRLAQTRRRSRVLDNEPE